MAKEKKQRAEVSDNKEQAKKDALKALNSKYGAGTIMKFSDITTNTNIEVIPSGSISIDHALGRGGYPKGRIVEIYGLEASGKTTLTLHAIAECQKQGGTVAFVDAEHALDPTYATALGVNMDDVILSQPDSGEQALNIVEELVRTNAIDMIVVDSVAALVPQAEIQGEMGDSHVGLQARMMSQALRKLTPLVHKSNCVLVFINQVRMKIGVMYGNPETTTGGNALKFYASVRLEVRKSTALKDGDDVLGNLTNVKVVKNKVAPPFKTASFNIVYGRGIDRMGEVLDFGISLGLVDKSGAWYSVNGERIGQGKENAAEYIKTHPSVLDFLESNIAKHFSKTVVSLPIEEDEVEYDPETGDVLTEVAE